jgi:rfaE bifunctional protein nucleotidyltransferase chain/domain
VIGQGKIHSIPKLAAAVAAHKAAGRRVAHCHGVFDLLHPGHIRHLKAAKALADVLVVTITGDRYVNKGPGRPAFNESLRAEFLSSIEHVDLVGINHSDNAAQLIQTIKPDVYVKGTDYVRREDDPTGKIYEEEQAILSVGGQIHFTDEIVFSSSQLINAHINVFPPETEDWLKNYRANHSADEVLAWLDKAATRTVAVAGEAIIDEYVFCSGLGKSSKDPILAFLHRSVESYAGGSLAVANHLAGLGCNVELVCQLGETDRREDFIRSHLLPNITPSFVTRHNTPTISKRRFVDTHTNARVFETYCMDEHDASAADQAAVAEALHRVAKQSDLVVVADYGHGMITSPAIATLIESSRFLAINTQANAGNRGYNLVSKYPRADYVCLAGHEAQLEARAPHANWNEIARVLTERIRCPSFTVTRGKAGSYHLTVPDQIYEAPALATFVADRVGAGDAVLAVTSVLKAVGAPWSVVAFLGNLAGAQMVADLGNRSTINRASLTKAVKTLLK